MSGSIESVRWNACVYRLDHGLYSHPKEFFWGMESETMLTPRENPLYRLFGLVVKASASRAEDPVFEFRWRRDISGSRHTSDLNIGTPVATLPGVWRYGVSAGTGRSGVGILRLGEIESLICIFYLSVAARTII